MGSFSIGPAAIVRKGKQMRQIACLGLVLLMAVFAGAQDPFPAGTPEDEEAVRARVDGFYGLFQEGRFREAEAFVAEESRDAFYVAPKTKIFSYEIQSVSFNSDVDEASVVVTVETVTPTPLSAVPMKQPLPSTWKRVDGDWYLKLREVKEGETFQTPAGPMNFDRTTGKRGAPPPNFRSPNLASMQTMYEVNRRSLEFSSDSTEPVTHTISVKNKFAAELTIERMTRDFPGMTIQIDSETIPKDGETAISFTYDPKAAWLTGRKNFDFVLMPITQRVRVVMVFR